MAQIKSGILGKMTGSVRNVTGRIRYGKNYLSGKPDHYKAAQDENSIARRKKFKLSAKFAKSINAIDDLKAIWGIHSANGLNAFNLITRVNYNLMQNDLLSSANIIMPLEGFPVASSSAVLNSSSLEVTLNAIGDSEFFDLSVEKYVKLYSVIYLSSPIVKGLEEYSFLSIESSKIPFQVEEQITFNVPLNLYQSALVGNYNIKSVYYAISTINDEEKSVHHSVTLYQ